MLPQKAIFLFMFIFLLLFKEIFGCISPGQGVGDEFNGTGTIAVGRMEEKRCKPGLDAGICC
jgi:hypothetical protein